jgi:hypothetical protein
MARFRQVVACAVVPWAALSLYTPRLTAADPPAAENPFGEPAPPRDEGGRAAANPFDDGPAATRSDTRTRRSNRAGRPTAAETPREDPTPRLEAKIREALAHPTIMEFIETPLQDAVEYLKDYHGIEIQFDNRALEDAGIGTDTPITRTLKGVSLASALQLLLDDLDATFVVRDGVLLVTTKAAVGQMPELRVYNVDKLVGSEADAHELADVLRSLFPNASVSRRQSPARGRTDSAKVGGPSARTTARPAESRFEAVPYRNLLVVRASQRDHQQLAQLLGEIKAKLQLGE